MQGRPGWPSCSPRWRSRSSDRCFSSVIERNRAQRAAAFRQQCRDFSAFVAKGRRAALRKGNAHPPDIGGETGLYGIEHAGQRPLRDDLQIATGLVGIARSHRGDRIFVPGNIQARLPCNDTGIGPSGWHRNDMGQVNEECAAIFLRCKGAAKCSAPKGLQAMNAISAAQRAIETMIMIKKAMPPGNP